MAADTNGRRDIFLYDDTDGSTTRVNLDATGNQLGLDSDSANISADGRQITYETFDGNVVAGDSNSRSDIFTYDTATATTTRVNVATDGRETNGSTGRASMSGDGLLVAFVSTADTLVDAPGWAAGIYRRDIGAQTTIRVTNAVR